MDRKKIYDYIRVLACICIIGIHSTGRSSYEFKEMWEKADYLLQSFFRIGLPIFFLLSGALLLSGRQNGVGEFYQKRFIKVIVPFFIYSLFYAVWVNPEYGFTDCLKFDTWKEILRNILPGIKSTLESYQAVPLWFVYTIVGIYLVTPFLKVMVQSMDEKMLLVLSVFLVFMRIVKNYFPLMAGFEIGVDYIFAGWIMYFILGYILIQPMMEKYYKYIEISGLATFLLSVITNRFFTQFVSKNFYDLAPHMILQACGMFVFLYRREASICKNEKLTAIIRVLSKYTFSVYLLHSFVMREVNESGVLEILSGNIIIQELLRIVLVFGIGFILAVMVDNSIIKAVQYLCEKGIEGLRTLMKKYKRRQINR